MTSDSNSWDCTDHPDAMVRRDVVLPVPGAIVWGCSVEGCPHWKLTWDQAAIQEAKERWQAWQVRQNDLIRKKKRR